MGFNRVEHRQWVFHFCEDLVEKSVSTIPQTSIFHILLSSHCLFDENESLRICEFVVDIVPRVRIIWIHVKIVGFVMNVHMT
jgi:hypothetical protein